MLINRGEWQSSDEDGEGEPEGSLHGVSLQQSHCRGPTEPVTYAGGTITLLQNSGFK